MHISMCIQFVGNSQFATTDTIVQLQNNKLNLPVDLRMSENPFSDISMEASLKKFPRIDSPPKKRSFQISKSQLKLPILHTKLPVQFEKPSGPDQGQGVSGLQAISGSPVERTQFMEEIQQRLKTVFEEQSSHKCAQSSASDEDFESKIHKNRQMIRNYKNKLKTGGQKSLLQLPVGREETYDPELYSVPQALSKRSFLRQNSKAQISSSKSIAGRKNKVPLKKINRVASIYQQLQGKQVETNRPNHQFTATNIKPAKEAPYLEIQNLRTQKESNIKSQVNKILKNIEEIQGRPKEEKSQNRKPNKHMNEEISQIQKQIRKKSLNKISASDKNLKKLTTLNENDSNKNKNQDKTFNTRQENLFEDIDDILVRNQANNSLEDRLFRHQAYNSILANQQMRMLENLGNKVSYQKNQKKYNSSSTKQSNTKPSKRVINKQKKTFVSQKQTLPKDNILVRKQLLMQKIRDLDKKIAQDEGSLINNSHQGQNFEAHTEKTLKLANNAPQGQNQDQEENKNFPNQTNQEEKIQKKLLNQQQSKIQFQAWIKLQASAKGLSLERSNFEKEAERLTKYLERNEKNMQVYLENKETLLILRKYLNATTAKVEKSGDT